MDSNDNSAKGPEKKDRRKSNPYEDGRIETALLKHDYETEGSSIIEEIGFFMKLLKAVWWLIKLPFRVIAFIFSGGGGDGD